MPKPCEPTRHLGRVLVTGGAGFVGSHIVDLLVARGCREIVVVDNLIRGRTENVVRGVGRARWNSSSATSATAT